MKRSLVRLALLAIVIGLAAASAFAETILTIGVDQEAIGLDPNIVTAFSSHRRIDLLYNKLVRLDDNMAIVPDLAESWENPDNVTYVFKLRKGVLFHNGRELKAEDVQYTLNRILDPKTASPGRSYITLIKAIDVVDPYTVRITLASPLPSLLDGLCSNNLAIVPKEEVEKNGNLQKVAVGTGAFMLKEWLPDNSMTLVKNPNYFEKGYPLVDKVIYRVIPEQASLYAGLRSGDLDIATISDGATVRMAAKDKSVVVMSKPGLNMRIFSFNTSRKPFDDARVRFAFALTLNRDEIIAAAEFGSAQKTGPLPVSAAEWALPPDKLPAAQPDIDRAKTLLAEAGYPNGFTFKLVCSTTYEGGLAVAQVAQEQLKKIGVTAQLEVVEWGVYIDRWTKRDFDTMIELRGGSAEPDRFLYRTFHSTGGVNNFLFKDADVDKLLDLGRSLTRKAERKVTYDKLQALLTERAPAVFLYCPYENQVLGAKTKGFKLVGNGSLYYLTQTTVVK
jgi:peptide/nickel transport system substrate-binding protein